MKIPIIMVLCTCLSILLGCLAMAETADNMPVSAPIMTDSAGKSGKTAFSSVWRVVCPPTDSMGTAFLHKSGKVVTAAHVVRGCKAANLYLLDVSDNPLPIADLRTDDGLDLAILTPATAIQAPALSLSSGGEPPVGLQVAAWGFPTGYGGHSPLLSVGYVAGIQMMKTETGKVVRQMVVNAAFNSGNSGGPVVNVEDGTVLGVVSSKLAPLHPTIESALKALESQASGFTYTAKMGDGTQKTFTEGQVVGAVLQYLRSQTQLVIGYAVPVNDLRDFLNKSGVSP